MKKRRKSEIVQIVLFLAFAVFLFLAIPRFVAERIIVEGDSMEATLFHNDNILVEKVSRYFGAIDRYDVIVFFPNEEAKKNGTRYYVKRVIGLPGETVQIKYGTVYINGKPIPEEYGSSPMDNAGIAGEPLVLVEDEYFVLGDNRFVSEDSRSERLGPVPAERIGGRVIFRLFPLKRIGRID